MENVHTSFSTLHYQVRMLHEDNSTTSQKGGAISYLTSKYRRTSRPPRFLIAEQHYNGIPPTRGD